MVYSIMQYKKVPTALFEFYKAKLKIEITKFTKFKFGFSFRISVESVEGLM
jgi:hypothetical protein